MSGLRLTGWMLASMALPGSASLAAGPPPDLVGGQEVRIGDSRILMVWGTGATILWPEDGRAWHAAHTRAAADLAQLAANDDGSVIVAVGAQGTLLRSTDAGRHWSALRAPSPDVYLLTRGALIAYGADGLIASAAGFDAGWTHFPIDPHSLK